MRRRGFTSCLNPKVHRRVRLFIFVRLDVDAIVVFAPDEGAALMRSVVHGFGWGSVTRSPIAFSATDARASPGC